MLLTASIGILVTNIKLAVQSYSVSHYTIWYASLIDEFI